MTSEWQFYVLESHAISTQLIIPQACRVVGYLYEQGGSNQQCILYDCTLGGWLTAQIAAQGVPVTMSVSWREARSQMRTFTTWFALRRLAI